MFNLIYYPTAPRVLSNVIECVWRDICSVCASQGLFFCFTLSQFVKTYLKFLPNLHTCQLASGVCPGKPVFMSHISLEAVVFSLLLSHPVSAGGSAC